MGDPSLSSDVSEYVAASYLSSLALNLDASMHLDYEECINKQVVDDPHSWATSFITGHSLFQVWSSNDRYLMAAEAADRIDDKCSSICPNDGTCNAKCDGCLTGLSYFYGEYSTYLDLQYDSIEHNFDLRMN